MLTIGILLLRAPHSSPADRPFVTSTQSSAATPTALPPIGEPVVDASPLASDDPSRASYAIYLYKLPGLAPTTRPGSFLDIWVTWKPPVTRRPKVQLLLEDVLLGGIETGYTEGPVANLLVDEAAVPDLIYGERFGSFNVTSPTVPAARPQT